MNCAGWEGTIKDWIVEKIKLKKACFIVKLKDATTNVYPRLYIDILNIFQIIIIKSSEGKSWVTSFFWGYQ